MGKAKKTGWEIPTDMATEAIAKDIKIWAEEHGAGMFLKKADIMKYAGLSRNMVDRIMYGVPYRGTQCHYYYKDVAGCLAREYYK